MEEGEVGYRQVLSREVWPKIRREREKKKVIEVEEGRVKWKTVKLR